MLHKLIDPDNLASTIDNYFEYFRMLPGMSTLPEDIVMTSFCNHIEKEHDIHVLMNTYLDQTEIIAYDDEKAVMLKLKWG